MAFARLDLSLLHDMEWKSLSDDLLSIERNATIIFYIILYIFPTEKAYSISWYWRDAFNLINRIIKHASSTLPVIKEAACLPELLNFVNKITLSIQD